MNRIGVPDMKMSNDVNLCHRSEDADISNLAHLAQCSHLEESRDLKIVKDPYTSMRCMAILEGYKSWCESISGEGDAKDLY